MIDEIDKELALINNMLRAAMDSYDEYKKTGNKEDLKLASQEVLALTVAAPLLYTNHLQPLLFEQDKKEKHHE